MLGSDGVVEKLRNEQVIRQVAEATLNPSKSMTEHAMCGKIVDSIFFKCVEQNSMDNLTFILIAFKNLKYIIPANSPNSIKDHKNRLQILPDDNPMPKDITEDWLL